MIISICVVFISSKVDNRRYALPIKGIQTKVGSGGTSKAKVGTGKELVGVICEDKEGHGMANMFSNANKVAHVFSRLGGKAGVVHFEVDGGPKRES